MLGETTISTSNRVEALRQIGCCARASRRRSRPSCLSKARSDYDQMVVLNDRDRHGKKPSSAVVLTSAGRFVIFDPCLHQRLQEFGWQLAVVEELDEALTGLVAGGLDRGLLGGEERRREPQRAVVLEVLKHPQIRLPAADVYRQVPLQLLPRLRIGVEAQGPERLEVRPLDVVELCEEVIDAF